MATENHVDELFIINDYADQTTPTNEPVRRWCFTLNNYIDPDDIESAKLWDIKYLVIGREIAPTTLTPHLQGFVIFKKSQRFTAVRRLFPRARWSHTICRLNGPPSNYCKKEDPDFIEIGDIGHQGKRSDLEATAELIADGGTLLDVARERPLSIIKYQAGVRVLIQVLSPKYDHDDVRGMWFWGRPGIGKSRWAREKYPDLFSKPINKWWGNYNGETTVLMDDFDKQGYGLSQYLKIWCDRSACTGEVKNGEVNLRHHRLIITSNYQISDIWPDDPMLLEALYRRFKIIHFDADHFRPYGYGDHAIHPSNADLFEQFLSGVYR